MPLRLLASLANFCSASFGLIVFCATIGMAQLSLAQLSLVDAAELASADSEDGKTILLLEGEIEHGDGEKLDLSIFALDVRKRGGVSALYLNSPGGAHREAVRMAEVVKRYKISTFVADGAECASGCFTIFAAGHEKFAGFGAAIGVHASSRNDGSEAHDTTFETARLVSAFGVPPAIVGKLVLTPPDRMAWLSRDDLQSMDVRIAGLLRWPGATVAAPRLTPFEAVAGLKGRVWEFYVEEVSERSRRIYGPDYLREICHPSGLFCTRSFYYFDKDDEFATRVTTVEDMSGNSVLRGVCKFNADRNVRSCFDWDTLQQHHANREPGGGWQEGAGE
ncbi:MAG: hypothetical protein K2Z80_01660 [Xanthobacteraceae bacterium]|nr:hypothetical protein [Xanthobacteraceae bacterium]